MDAIIDALKQKAIANPSNALLQSALTRLEQVHVPPTMESKTTLRSLEQSWEVVQHELDELEAADLWSKSGEEGTMLQDARQEILSAANPSKSRQFTSPRPGLSSHERDISIVLPPPSSWSSGNPNIPLVEFTDTLNGVQFLHFLATNPAKVLPPGKSLLSVLSNPLTTKEPPNGTIPSLKDRVQEVVHRAFWDEARETLSHPIPSRQVARIQLLYKDLYTALIGLLPKCHPVLAILSSPLSPTSSPLLSVIHHLREVLAPLRERCAPVRDSYIDELVGALNDHPPSSAIADLAKLVVESVQSILKLSDVMKDDLSQFVLGSAGDQQLKAAVFAQAKMRERSVVIDIWGSERIKEVWASWMTELHHDGRATDSRDNQWIRRLVKALGADEAVSCPLPDSFPQGRRIGNALPPPFFFCSVSLLYIQNFLQALVIAAALRSLIRFPLLPSEENGDFMERVWTLLRAEVDEAEGSGDTKLINLADEAVRAQKAAEAIQHTTGGGKELEDIEEKRLRAAVERILQYRDPVFILLQKRLIEALTVRLIQPHPTAEPSQVPEHMQTGRDRKKPRLYPELMRSNAGTSVDAGKEPNLAVKGFEDPILSKAIGEVLREMRMNRDWVETVWGDLVEFGEMA